MFRYQLILSSLTSILVGYLIENDYEHLMAFIVPNCAHKIKNTIRND